MARRSLLPHEDADWDPMSADYYDPNFNNYTQGPGSRLDRQLQPFHPRLERENAVFKLYIKNVPPKLSEAGIRNVFLNFGNLLAVYRHPPGYGSGWAFVSYASHREAELAIRELNNTPPFYFKVQFARSISEKERIRKERENDEMLRRVLDSEPYPVYSERVFVPFNRGIGRGRGVPLPRQMVAGCRPGFDQLLFCHNDNANGEDTEEDMGYFSSYVPGAYDETNRMIMQQGMNLTFDSSTGKRWVSMGRGYFPSSERPSVGSDYDIEIKTYIKEEKRILAESVERMYDRECNGWYEYGQKMDMTGSEGNCVYCERITTQYCQRCKSWYCTRDCQVKDWPRHKAHCFPIPPLGDALKSPGSQQNYVSAQCSDLKQRHEQRLGRNDVSQDSIQNRHGSSDGVGQGDGRIKSHFGREEQSKANSKENQFKQTIHDRQNRSTGCNENRNGHMNAQFSGSKKDGFRSSNSFSEDRTGAPEAKRGSVNERLCVGRHVERNGNTSLASDDTTSPKIQQESQLVSSSMSTGPIQKTVSPLTESIPNVAVVSTDSLPAKAADAVKKVKTPDVEVSSVVKKMETLNLRDSTTVGCNSCEELPKDRFTKVKVTVTVGPMEYWVQPVDSEPNFLYVTSILFNALELFPCEFEVGAMCAALYEGHWYRGKVTSVKPELKVFYIDFGNEEVCTPDQLKAMPSSIVDTPALALNIKLAEGTSEKYSMLKVDDSLFVKPVEETSDGATLVHVEGELYESAAATVQEMTPLANCVPQKSAAAEQTVPETSLPSPRLEKTPAKCPLPQPKQKLEMVPIKHTHSFAVEGLKVGMQGGGQFRQQLTGEDCTVTIVYPELKEQFTKLFIDLHRACVSAPVDKNYKPSIGDMVATFAKTGSAEEGETWNRAHILSIGSSGYRVNFCDVGQIGNVNTVKKLPRNFALIPEFAARCSVISCARPREKLWSAEINRFLFTVTNADETQKTVTCVLRSVTNEELCKAVLKQWVPSVEDEGLKSIEVKNNDTVILQVFFDQKSLYVRPTSSSSKDMFCQLIQDVGLHCMKAPELDHMPKKNEMVACKFVADGNYYRAKVLDVGKQSLKVIYVDFGNLDCVTTDRLKPLPDALKKIPCMAVKVALKDVVDKPMTKETNDFLSSLVGGEVEMKLILTESRKDGVQLILPDGSSLNDRLNTVLEPGWKKAMAAGKDPTDCKVFMEHDIEYLELPVGQTIDFLVLHKMDGATVMGCEAYGKILAHVHTTMIEEMNNYCNSAPEKSYVPRYSELCLARFEDGVWYRAMGLEDRPANEYNIIFLDFGNMAHIDKTNIRRMVPDYVKMPAVAVLCLLKGLKNSTETVKKRACELVQVNKIYKARVVSCFGPGNYSIEFPHVTEVLMKENLLPAEK